MKDHWIEIRHGAQRCFAQIEDCGPYRTDDANYVFKNERTLPHPNNAPHSMSVLRFDNFLDSGLDVCAAVVKLNASAKANVNPANV